MIFYLFGPLDDETVRVCLEDELGLPTGAANVGWEEAGALLWLRAFTLWLADELPAGWFRMIGGDRL